MRPTHRTPSSRLLPTPRLSRRALLAAGGAVGAGAFVSACGGDSANDSAASGGSGGGQGGAGAFRFTDDRGETVTLDGPVERIVAFIGSAAVLADYGVECVGVFGPTRGSDGTPDQQAGEVAVDRVTILGQEWGEFDLEEYALLEPQLVVSNMFEQDVLWYVPEESAEEVTGLAASVGILVAPTADQPRVTLTTPIERYAELAEALGADLSSDPVRQARTRFQDASEALRRAARDNPGIRVLACSADPDLFYASNPGAAADLTYFQELGVELIVPEELDDLGFFQSLSWENADTYPADILLMDSRSVAVQPEALADKPTWNRLPAVQAGQVIPWQSEPRYSYAGCAPLLEDLAEAVGSARKVV
ncbi:ABC transporter substrate-binding protein [Streptomyces sp. 4N509B]|uniref:ABC transporter substrate-binding protein n=1 Tax=Streptomyces sp. 4N509B TaxID=3457413 RepID=UPI003FD4ACAF